MKKDNQKIYLIGSLRNPDIPEIANTIRKEGFEVFDDWHAAGPTADDEWKRYEKERGRNYAEALEGYHAYHVWGFDKHHLDTSDAAILVLPAGRSGHLELGYIMGQGKPGFILLDDSFDNEGRFDVMYRFATKTAYNLEEILDEYKRLLG